MLALPWNVLEKDLDKKKKSPLNGSLLAPKREASPGIVVNSSLGIQIFLTSNQIYYYFLSIEITIEMTTEITKKDGRHHL